MGRRARLRVEDERGREMTATRRNPWESLGFGAIYFYLTAMESSKNIRRLELIGPRRAGPLSVPCLGRHYGLTWRPRHGTTTGPCQARARWEPDRAVSRPCFLVPCQCLVPGPDGQV